MSKFDVGIYGLWYGHNYGSIITYYALYKVLEENGHSCAMIDNPLNIDHDIDKLRRSHPLKFARDHYNIAQNYPIDKMGELNRLFDTFVIGSDQMWNVDLSRPYRQTYFLDFVNNEKRSFSYAVSFGKETYGGTNEEAEKSKNNLSRFTAVSVRDDFSKSILEKTFNTHSDIVLDPVFLCDKQRYDELICECKDFKIGNKFAFAYILDPNIVIGDNLSRIADELDIPIYVCFNESGDKQKFKQDIGIHSDKVMCLDDPTVQEWLYMFKNSEFILTDSYHGACFSIIYNKPFVVKKNMRRGGMRFEHLINSFSLKDNMITDPSSFYVKAISLEHSIKYNLDNDLMRFSRQWIKRI